MHSLISFAIIIAPLFLSEASIMPFLDIVFRCLSISIAVSSASFLDGVTSMLAASSSCSACDSISAATKRALALSSAMTSISEGPAIISIPTNP